jgi:glycosyltransferase involved in cell wall biosynthesis
MRLVIFINSMDSGGAERVTANLANAWVERGWEITLVTLWPQAVDFYTLHPGVKRIALNLYGISDNLAQGLWANLRRVGALRRVLRELRPDFVVGMMATAILVILAARGLPCRVIVSEHIYPPMLPLGRIWALLRRIAYPWAFRVTMLTTEGVRWLAENVPAAKGVVMPNPVLYPLPAGEPVLQPESVVPQGRKLLLAVGRLDVQKGFDLLLKCFATVAHQYPSWHLVILGEGSEKAALEQQVAALGLQDRAALPGRTGNVGDWYERADLYVMSSRFEGFPSTLAEAMAYGCPTVSYDCETGPRDIIRPGIDGLLVTPVGDIQALARALAQLMGDELERKRMAGNAAEVRERYSLARILGMWDELFKPGVTK